VVRRYAALIWGHLEGDRLTVDRPIARDPRDRKRMAIVNTGRSAKTDFLRLARFDAGDLLRAHLHTGRTHQIRVHLASINHPVVGDATYNEGRDNTIADNEIKKAVQKLDRFFLHAQKLSFTHPQTREKMSFESPLPEELDTLLNLFGP